jgi:hypothetical protein
MIYDLLNVIWAPLAAIALIAIVVFFVKDFLEMRTPPRPDVEEDRDAR